MIVVGMLFEPSAVLFDYGNVLSMAQNLREIEEMAAVFGVPVAEFEKAYWKDRLAFDRADVTPEDYWRDVAAMVSRELLEGQRERLVQLDNLSWAYASAPVVQWAKELRGAGV